LTRPVPTARTRRTRTATNRARRVLRRCLRRLGATATLPAAPASSRGPSCGLSRRQRRSRSSQYIAAPGPCGAPERDDRPSRRRHSRRPPRTPRRSPVGAHGEGAGQRTSSGVSIRSPSAVSCWPLWKLGETNLASLQKRTAAGPLFAPR
jgi:hypothetical protein